MKLEQPKGPVLEGKPLETGKELDQSVEGMADGVTGGVSKHFGDPVAMAEEGRVRAEALQAYGEAKSVNATPEAKTPVKAEKPLDVSMIKNQIATLENKKKGLFDFGRTKDSIDLLKIALNKITDSKYKGEFARDYIAALAQGGEKLAMEYARDIGAGKLVKPVDGVLMTTDKRHANKFIG